ncbi:beta/gamma crystallin domain-containing protein 1-like isoform X2 [Antennarius striatus]|uniref:beta/gamma crystallin domain-containing protein 1-like isoform X2 n=1 Tax=Antennarius striatus TaxID=241820 RepID=UPI0035B13BED
MSESSEEQPSPGVLSRIGSWFSPWRTRTPTSPTETSPTRGEAEKTDGEEEGGESTRTEARERRSEEEENLSGDILPRKEEDAKESAHKESSGLCIPELTDGGPTGEEFVWSRKSRRKEREEGSGGISESGNPEKNASHLTHLSSSSEQGVVWDAAQNQPRAQGPAHAQTGRRLHVYLEETSVIQCGREANAGEPVVHTKVTKSLEIPRKSTSSLDSLDGSGSTSEETKRINASPVFGTESTSGGSEGVSPNSGVNRQFEEETGGDGMGRKNGRRKSRKNFQGDAEKSPPKVEPVSDAFPTSDNSVISTEAKSPKTLKGESPINSSSEHGSAPEASPEQTEGKTSCLDAAEPRGRFHDRDSVAAASLERVVDSPANMEEKDSLQQVEGKSEAPEPKRRSIKVSRSEVKLITKNVRLNAKLIPDGDKRDVKTKKLTKVEDKPPTEGESRPHQSRARKEELKPELGRIADKIRLFEETAERSRKQTFQTPRSVDASPVRTVSDRLKADFTFPEQRSKSADPYDKPRSSSPSPSRERPMTIKERTRNFTEATKRNERRAPPPKAAMTGMSQEHTLLTSLKSQRPNNQGKPAPRGEMQSKTVSRIALEPEERDSALPDRKISDSDKKPTDSKSEDAAASKTEDKGEKTNRTETQVQDKESDVSVEPTSSVSQQSKRISRSKRRKSREPTSPSRPKSENDPDQSAGKPTAASARKLVDDAKETTSDTKLTDEIFLQADEAKGIAAADEQSLLSGKEDAFKNELKVLDREPDASSLKEHIDKPERKQDSEGLVSQDEPDTTASISRTKAAIDQVPEILPQEEEKARGHCPLFTPEREQVPEDNGKVEKVQPPPPHEEQESPVRHPRLGVDLKSRNKIEKSNKSGQTEAPRHKEAELITQTERKDVEKLENVDGNKTNETKTKRKEKPQQLRPSDEIILVSDGGEVLSERGGGVGKVGERKNTREEEKSQRVTNKHKPQDSRPEPESEVSERTSTDDPPERQHGRGRVEPRRTRSDEEPPVGNTTANLTTDLKSTESGGTEWAVIRAETQFDSVSVEKSDNPPDESWAHGANGAEVPSEKPISKASTAAEGPTTNAANGATALITKKLDSLSGKKLRLKKPTSVSASKSVCSEGAPRDDEKKTSAIEAVPSEVKISGDIKVASVRLQREASKDEEEINDSTSVKAAETTGSRPADSAAPVTAIQDKTLPSATKEESRVGNGELLSHPDLQTVKKQPPNGKSPTPKAPTSPETKKLFVDSIQLSSMKFDFSRGLSKDDSTTQDVPSSWLDLDFPKQKLKVSAPKLTYSGSESNLLDTSGELDDDDFVEKIKNLCAPFSLPPRKHHPLRPPQPPFAMPAIKEDRFEKTFDPREFKFGLSKKNKFSIDTTPSQLAKLQNNEAKSSLKPARASLADRSILISSMDLHSRLKDKDEGIKEEKEEVKVKSRLEGSCVLSSLASSSFRGRRDGVQTQEEGTSSGEGSPTEAPQKSPPPSAQPPPPSPTTATPFKDTLVKENLPHSRREEAQTRGNEVNDSGPPFPSFNDAELPEYFHKYLPQKPAKPVLSIGQEQDQPKVTGKMVLPVVGDEADQGVKLDQTLPEAASPSSPGSFPGAFPASPSAAKPTFPELKKAQFKKRTAKEFHKRPGKMVIYEKDQFSGQVYEIHRDVADATTLNLSSVISVKVIRGCWVLYEKPDFQGRPIALEEGGIELTNVWAESGMETNPDGNPPMQIGSIRFAVRDYSVPRIDLFTEPEGLGRVTTYHDDAIETGSFGVPLSTASIQVHSGVWLLFSDMGFQGMLAVLEKGVYPFPETWGFMSPFVGSLRPLKMGALKVEHPNEVKAIVYEKPGFEGSGLEIDGDVFSFGESDGGLSAEAGNLDPEKKKSVGSVKILSGLWVGYSEPGFEGQQHILEEGEYPDCSEWGSSDQLLSLRPILSDFLSPHLKMFSDRDFGDRGINIDVTVPVLNMNDTGYGSRTQSVDVIGGSWVVFEKPGFCGDAYILEKGLYGSPEDWGALQPTVASVMPVVLEDFESAAKFKVQLFSEPGFQGSVLTLQDSVTSLPDGFSVGSCKVLVGSWLAFDAKDFTGRMYVLEAGSYADLRAMGCVHAAAAILSLQTVGFDFSLPAITLFERGNLRGKRVILTDGTVNLQLAGGCSRVQSLLVEGGIWVLYEGINYRGAQVLLRPGAVPDWHKVSGWRTIGSLRPLLQKQVHFRLRNRQSGLVMSVTGDLDDIKLLRIHESEETGGLEQIWFYQNGHLHCKLLEDCCLTPSSSVTIAGARVGLDPEPDNNHLQRWTITPEGFIAYTPAPGLVLEVKGGNNYDKNLVILNEHNPNKGRQQWIVEVI